MHNRPALSLCRAASCIAVAFGASDLLAQTDPPASLAQLPAREAALSPDTWRKERRIIDLHMHIDARRSASRARCASWTRGIGIGVNLSGGTVTHAPGENSAFERVEGAGRSTASRAVRALHEPRLRRLGRAGFRRARRATDRGRPSARRGGAEGIQAARAFPARREESS